MSKTGLEKIKIKHNIKALDQNLNFKHNRWSNCSYKAVDIENISEQKQ